MIKVIKDDLRFYGGKGLLSVIITFFFKNSFRLMLNYRIGNYLHKKKCLLARVIVVALKHRQLKLWNCHFSYDAVIGIRLNLPHPVGIVIGSGVKIQDNVTLYQNTTLGQNKNGYPVIESNCIVYPNSVIAGDLIIGEGSIIGALCFVSSSVSKGSIIKKEKNN